MKTVYEIQENGTITTDSKAQDVMLRKWTCNGCGFSQTTIMSNYQANKLWGESHGFRAHSATAKAFDEMMGNPLDSLASLSIR